METSNQISVVSFDYIEKRVFQYSDVRPDSENRQWHRLQREKYFKNNYLGVVKFLCVPLYYCFLLSQVFHFFVL